MPRVVALYRYPVKSLTPESREMLTIGDDGKVTGDRVLGFRFADTAEPDEAWSRKHGMLALVNTPGLARLRLTFDDAALRLSFHLDNELLVEDGLDHDGRKHIASAIAGFALGLDESGLEDHPERLPLRLIGDGVTSRYHDSPLGTVSLHGRSSLASLAETLGDPELSEVRFRSNIAVDGIEAWQELAWSGRRLRIGSACFRVDHNQIRCLATHANPESGERDRPVLTTLTREFKQDDPTFGIAMFPEGGGQVYVGDEVELID